jgi:hypothetical protein
MTIIHVRYGRGWRWADFVQNDSLVREMVDSVEHEVHYILDARDAGIPRDLVAHFPEMVRTATSMTHPRSGRVVLLGLDTYMDLLWSIYKRMYPRASQKIFTAKTLEEAVTQLLEPSS